MQKNYNVQLINSIKKNNISIPENKFLLDAAEENNIELPYSCRIGSCSTCVAKIIKGSVKHINQTFLDKIQLKNNFILTCVCFITSDSILLINQEKNLYL